MKEITHEEFIQKYKSGKIKPYNKFILSGKDYKSCQTITAMEIYYFKEFQKDKYYYIGV
jgi:hypothetical protein